MSYTANDIVSLSAGRAFREKIGMYLSADRQEAINLGLRELIVNVQDEYEVYKPKDPVLDIILDTKNKIITVIDNMRGIPVGKRDDGMNSLTAAFLIPHSGGKHEEGVYSSAIGINGEGNKVVCHTAAWLEVEVKRDNKIYTQRFESDNEGAHPTSDVKSRAGTAATGTKITYHPDEKVYGDVFIDIPALRKMLQETSYFTIGLKINLNIDGKTETFYSKNGLIDGLSKENRMFTPFSYFLETEDCKVELALQWVTKGGELKGYANGLYMKDGGDFMTAFKRSLTTNFNKLSREKFDGESIRKCLDGFVSVKVKMGQFSNQAKTSLANKEAAAPTSNAIANALKDFSESRRDDFKRIVDTLIKIQRAENAANKARETALAENKNIDKELKKKVILADKLADCKYHDERSQLMICEGHSAKGALVKARNSDTTACFELRGKMLNVLKASDDKASLNEEIKMLHIVLGCGLGDKFNMRKLRYGKIVMMADMDKDGYAIACLILSFFYHYYPELLKAGKVYWGVTPLFKVEVGKKSYYAYDEAGLAKLPKGTVTRLKGLGESLPEEFRETIFSKDAKMIQITMKDAEAAWNYFDILLGENIEERKEYIFSHANFETLED